MQLELVSFSICPFVQRAVITLIEKKVSYELTYIDLENPPKWFNEISPFGKVPLLKVDGHVLFESAIICEFLDESFPPSLHPETPLERATQRAWIEFGSSLFFEQVNLLLARDEETYLAQREAMGGALARLSQVCSDGPFFGGDRFALIDAAFAPFFMRYDLLQQQRAELAEIMPGNLAEWSRRLLERDSVKLSVVEDFPTQFLDFFRAKGSYMLTGD